jgi:integral membrane protein
MLLDFRSPVSRVVSVGRIEGVSTLVLFFIAMPLKYGFGQPMAVSYAGWIHGILFISLAVVTFIAWISKLLSFRQSCLVAIGALLPFGPFVVERWLPKQNAR